MLQFATVYASEGSSPVANGSATSLEMTDAGPAYSRMTHGHAVAQISGTSPAK